MQTVFLLGHILLVVLVGAMSPGPSFLTVARISMSRSKSNGLTAALAMATGAMLFSLLAILGLSAVFFAFPVMYFVLQIIGGVYLVYVGLRLWRHARERIEIEPLAQGGYFLRRNDFREAFLIQISNPKTIVFYSSIFASMLPQGITLPFVVALPLLVFLVELSWYSFVALTLSSAKPRAIYLRLKVWIDRCAGTLMGLLGFNFLIAAVRFARKL